jgi:putative endonuclease
MKKWLMKFQNKSTYKFGLFSESIAIVFLMLKGYSIVAKRYKTPLGEIDIIAKKAKSLIGIEVKARRKEFDISDVISAKQKKRIINGIKMFLSKNQKYNDYTIRFDVIAVRPFRIPKHIINSWEGEY